MVNRPLTKLRQFDVVYALVVCAQNDFVWAFARLSLLTSKGLLK